MKIRLHVSKDESDLPRFTKDNPYPDNLLIIYDEHSSLTKVLVKLHKRYAKRALACYGGRNRNVFKMPGGYVVKLPSGFDGIQDNDWEGSISNSPEGTGFDCGYIQYARTRMCYYKEVPIVFMEYVEYKNKNQIIELFGKEPDWCLSVDCGQVGVNKGGRLVAFDYGCR